MVAFAKSAGVFLWGMLRRAWAILPAFLLDPFDLVNKFILPLWFPSRGPLEMPVWLFPYVFGAGVFLAAVLSFHEIRVGIGRKRKIVKKLKNLYLEGEKFINEKLSNDEEFHDYEKRMFEWANSTSLWIQKNMSNVAASQFRRKENIMPFRHDNDFNDKHMGYINFISRLRDNLGKLIESGVWDKDS